MRFSVRRFGVAWSGGAITSLCCPLTIAAGQFISLRFAPKPLPGPVGFLEVALSDSRSGAIIRRLLPASSDGMQVTGLSLDHSGDLWITYSKGPVDQNDTAGGDPRPGSCANEIDILHAATGRLSVFLQTGSNVLISRATPSPDGRLLAYAESGCANGFFNAFLRVTRLSTGRSLTIGKDLPPCHQITGPSWTTDGRALLVGYAPATAAATAAAAAPGYTGGQGTCFAPDRERLVELNPALGQTGINGISATADPGCEITSVSGIAGDGVLAIEACGSGPDYLSGSARLLVLDARLRQVRAAQDFGSRALAKPVTTGRLSGA